MRIRSLSVALACTALIAIPASLAAQATAPLFHMPTVPVGPSHELIVHDLDGDGREDIALANYAGQRIIVHLSQGNGLLGPPLDRPTGGFKPFALAAADLNQDGVPDLAVAAYDGVSVLLIYKGMGDGTFDTAVQPPVDADSGVATADFDEDGWADLVVADDVTESVTVLLSRPHFEFEIGPALSVPTEPYGVATGDFDGDGHADVVTIDSTPNLSVLYGAGDGTLSEPQWVALPSVAYSLTVADVNADQRSDVITAHGSANFLNVVLGQAGGDFIDTPPITLDFGWPRAVAADDLDEDGFLDLVSANYSGDSITTFLGHGDGHFTKDQQMKLGTSPDRIASCDLNGDGDRDLAVISSGEQTLITLLGRGDGTFPLHADVPVPGTWRGSGDFDEDGHPDLVTADGTELGIWLGQGGTSFVEHDSIALPAGLSTVLVDDLDEDGHLDLAAASTGLDVVSVLRGEGNGDFVGVTVAFVGADPLHLAAGDVNGDGLRDLAVALVGGSVKTLLGTGGGNVTLGPSVTATVYAHGLAMADFDGDGRADLAAAEQSFDWVKLLRGQADGSLKAYAVLGVHGAPADVVTADFDGDGRADLASANASTSTVTLFLGQGDGSFGDGASWFVGNGANSLAVADLDSDGAHDLLCIDLGGTLSVLLAPAAPGFAGPRLYYALTFPREMVVADFDADSRPDVIAWGNDVYDPHALMLNQGGSESFPWTNLGHPLPGRFGAPLLFGKGTLQAGSSGKLVLEQAAALAPAVLFVSPESHPMPFKGGVLFPVPVWLGAPVATGPAGKLTLAWPSWPAGIAGGELFFQCAIQDAVAVAGVALSNAVRADLP